MSTPLVSREQRKAMLEHGRRLACDPAFDPPPVVRLLVRYFRETWLLAALDPDDMDLAYGLIDPGMGNDGLRLGYVRLSELAQWQNSVGCKVVRDPWFRARGALSDYEAAAYAAGFLVG